ncbi:hypothetical protein HON22_00495 [Candidatus Peregrinibacteria bacterium]|nr:hypothetical protein [Candidatus Peregrinibacteria bacterium]
MWKTYMTSGIIVLFALSLTFFTGIHLESPTGYFSFVDIAPQGFFYEEPTDLSQTSALQSLNQAEDVIKEIKNLNLSTDFVDDAFIEANSSYILEDYGNVFKVTQLISYIKSEKIEFLDQIQLVKNKEQEYMGEGINTDHVKVLIKKSEGAFYQDQLDESHEILTFADDALEQARSEESRVKTLTVLSKNFFVRYWWQISLVLIFLAIIIPPLFMRIRKQMIKKKIIKLTEEMAKIKEVIKLLQKDTFIEKKITPKTYRLKVIKSEERITEIKHTLPVLEAQLKGRKKSKYRRKKTKGILKIEK